MISTPHPIDRQDAVQSPAPPSYSVLLRYPRYSVCARPYVRHAKDTCMHGHPHPASDPGLALHQKPASANLPRPCVATCKPPTPPSQPHLEPTNNISRQASNIVYETWVACFECFLLLFLTLRCLQTAEASYLLSETARMELFEVAEYGNRLRCRIIKDTEPPWQGIEKCLLVHPPPPTHSPTLTSSLPLVDV